MPTLDDALQLCKILRVVSPKHGAHFGLTGSLLYAGGERKDIDLLIYRIRQINGIDFQGLYEELEEYDFRVTKKFGFVTKATWHGFEVDIMNPEYDQLEGDEYPGD